MDKGSVAHKHNRVLSTYTYREILSPVITGKDSNDMLTDIKHKDKTE